MVHQAPPLTMCFQTPSRYSGALDLPFYDFCCAGIGAEVEAVGVAERLQSGLRCAAAYASLAMQQQDRVLVLHAAWQSGFDLVERQVDGSWKMAGVEFANTAHIDQQRTLLQIFLCRLRRNLSRALKDKVEDYGCSEG